MHEQVATQGLVGRDHEYEVDFCLTFDTKETMHYRVFHPFDDEGEMLKLRLKDLIGENNIVELSVGVVEKYYYGVHLRLKSDVIQQKINVYDPSPMSIEQELREMLPEDHLVGISILRVRDLGAFGWTR